MEILSTGEKIKRTRIYSGITLKELCGDRISISKMSCIENGKVKADEEILRYVADKLKIDYKYLAKDVYDQIISNIEDIDRGNINISYEKSLEFNLEYAIDYDYIDLSMQLIHKLFRYYLDIQDWLKISNLVPTYYNLYSKSEDIIYTIQYFNDLGEYLIHNNEFTEASLYYTKILDLVSSDDFENEGYINALYKLGICNLNLKNYIDAKKSLENALYYVDENKYKNLYIDICHMMIQNNIFLDKEDENIKNIVLNHYSEDNISIINKKLDYVKAYFIKEKNNEAKILIEDIFKNMPNESTDKVADILVKSLKILKEYNQFEYIEKILEDALNIAISINDLPLIERVYYIKGMYLQEQGKYDEGEMHLNLSLDALAKFGSKKDLYDRYIDLGELNHKVNNFRESIKYFSLAMDIQRKIKQ